MIFEQHERWLAELREHTNRKETVTCRAGYMQLTAIADEIETACADAREHGKQQLPSWESIAADIDDSLEWIGPDLRSLVDTPARAVLDGINNDLLITGSGGGRQIDDTKRPFVARQTAALKAVLDHDDVLVAAWRDLVRACQDNDHTRYPSERIAFLRDTLVALSEYHKQDRRHFSPIETAVQVLAGNRFSVEHAQAMVGDPVDESTQVNPYAPSVLTEDERADLAARCVSDRPQVGQYVVWFRLREGYLRKDPCVTHGDITFYEAQSLASLLANHDSAREVLNVVPEELLTDEIREMQLSGKVDDYKGFQYEPGLVYARVIVHDVEYHLATETARMHLEALLAVVGVHDDMWKILGGHLFFDASPGTWNLPGAMWGPKVADPPTTFYQNDHFATDLANATSSGRLITAGIAQQLQPSLRLLSALTSTPRDNAEAVVMAAVRAIEHCNAWSAPTARLHWNAFIDAYLLDEYTLTTFARRVASDVFAAAVHYLPDHTRGAVPPAELEAIKKDIVVEDGGWGTRIDMTKTVVHVPSLRTIYADHWLARQLAETGDILPSGAALGTAFDGEKQRVDARVKRLKRSRNAAIHGGPLSHAACDTIADFATTLARQALNTIIWANVTGQQVDAYATNRRDEYRQRILNLQQGGDLANLFRLT